MISGRIRGRTNPVIALLNELPRTVHIKTNRHGPTRHRFVRSHRSAFAPERTLPHVQRQKDRTRLHYLDDLGLDTLQSKKFEQLRPFDCVICLMVSTKGAVSDPSSMYPTR